MEDLELDSGLTLSLLLASWEGLGTVDTDLRTSLVAAAAAAILSSVVGIVAGVGFGILLLRAILGGVFIGGLVYGGFFVAKRYLPGLAPAGEAGAQDAPPGFGGAQVGTDGASEGPGAAEARGQSVDIVLPGEAPDAFFREGESQPGESAAFPEAVSLRSEERSAKRSPREAVSESVEEAEAVETEDLGSLIGPEEAEGGGTALPRAEGAGSAAFDDLDVLPDLEGFSDSFAPSDFHGGVDEGEGEASVPRRSATSASRGDGRTESLDPAQLAKAVRTILKRDQKG